MPEVMRAVAAGERVRQQGIGESLVRMEAG